MTRTTSARASDRPTVLIADIDADVRRQLADLLGSAGFDSIQATSGFGAIELARDEQPWLTLVDLRLPDISGYEVCSELREEFGNDLGIVLLSADRTEPMDRSAGLLVGADEYLVKPLDASELLARIRRLSKRVVRTVPAHEVARLELPANLTPRELEVLTLLAAGAKPREIAATLVISEKTVSSHLQRVLAKLGVSSRTQAVALAYSRGLVRLPVERAGTQRYKGPRRRSSDRVETAA
jgi:DNA-binding NarL/FixJ family response regulator